MSTYLNILWKMIVFIGIQYTLGRRGSYPYGLLVNFSLIKITILVVISDAIQTIALLNIFEYSFEKSPILNKLKNHLTKKRKKKNLNGKSKKSFWAKTTKWKEVSVVIIAALPYGGGALSGSIMAYSMKMKKKKAFLLIFLGCIIGSILFYLGFYGIIELVDKIK